MKYFLFLVMLVSFGKCYGKSVLWPISGWQSDPRRVSRYSSLVSLLESNGYTLDTTYAINSKNLLNYDVIVICLWSVSALTSEEVDSLESYQQSKDGCVLLTADYNFCANDWKKPENMDFMLNVFNCVSQKGGIIIMSDYQSYAPIRPVTQRFYMDVGLSTISPSDLWFDSLDYSYCFFTGIDSLYFRQAGELSATSPAKVIGWAPDGKPTLACFNCDHCTGVNEKTNSTQKLLRAIPNPFYHSVKIEGTSGNIRVYDLSGKLATEANSVWNGKDLNSNEVSPGVYFLKAKNCRALKVIKLGN